MSQWPHDDTSSLIAFYGNPHGSGFGNNLVLVKPPWQMTYEGKPIRGVQIHRKCADSLAAVFNDIAEQVGHDWSKLPRGAVAFSGSYNDRAVRGSSRLSCHAFGAAIDMDAEHNPMNHDHESAMSPIVIGAFKRQGWFWGGDFQSRQDPMHFQAANEGSRVAELASDLNPVSSAQAADDLPPMTDGHSLAEEAEKPQATVEELPQQARPQSAPDANDDSITTVAQSLPKSLFKSKQAWAQTVLAFFGLGSFGTQVDASVWEKAKAFFTSPGFVLLVILTCVGLTIYWRWADHGRGKVQS